MKSEHIPFRQLNNIEFGFNYDLVGAGIDNCLQTTLQVIFTISG